MKPFFAIATLLIAVSMACTLKSAGSQSSANGESSRQPSGSPPVSTTSQTSDRCTLKLAGAPAVHGLSLGMTADEVLSLFPGSKDDPDLKARLMRPPEQFGTSQFVIHPEKYESKDSFAGVGQIVFSLLDGRVFSIYVGYNGPQFSHVDQFVEKISQQFSLPPASQWDAFTGMDTTLKTLKCDEFHVEAFIGGKGGSLNHLTVKDLVAEKKLNERSEKADKQAQGSPTPKK